MPHSTAPLWPQHAASNSEANSISDPWGLGPAIETQTRLWNQWLDANRSFWSLYTPWLQTAPWLLNAALAPQEVDDADVDVEAATTATGIPDALELQARSWNRFLDANRSFWTSISWPVPAAPWMTPSADDEPSEEEEEEENKSAHTPSAPRAAARKAKTSPRSRAR